MLHYIRRGPLDDKVVRHAACSTRLGQFREGGLSPSYSNRHFHWQSQNTTSIQSPTGQRYINRAALGYRPLLFVREHKHLPAGPYTFLGPTDHASHQGSRPTSITWRLRTPMPARLTRITVRQAAG